MKLLDLPHKRPIAVVVIFSLLALVGIIEYTRMKYELTPPIDVSYLTVQTIYPGASPQEVEDQVTKKLEDAISGVARMTHIASRSLENVSVISLEFSSGTNLGEALQDVQRLVNAELGSLPEGVKTPSVNKFSLDDYPIMQIAVTANVESGELYQLVKDTVKTRLARIDGVGQVTMLGGNETQVRVAFSQSKLEGYGISILQALRKIGSANLDFPAGSVTDADGKYVVRIEGKLKDLGEMRDLVIAQAQGGGSVRLGDVAEVSEALADSETIFRYDGKNAIGLLVLKQNGENAVEVSKGVHSAIAAMERQYKARSLHFDIAQDSSVFTLGSARDVIEDIALAIAFVGLIMLLFLHDLRNAFIIMMAIPTTLLTTFIGIGVGGFTLNLLTLLALTLVIGILVDDSIVVVENIHRHRSLGKSPKEAARSGTREIAFAATSVTLVIIVAFLPVSLAGGLIGSILVQFGITIVLATAISLVVSLFLTPLLAARMEKAEGRKATGPLARLGARFSAAFDRSFQRVTAAFLSIFDWATRHKAATVGAAVALFVFSVAMLATGLVGAEFVVQIDRGEFNVSIELPERTSLAQNDRIMQDLEARIRSWPEVAHVYSKVGYSSSGSSEYQSAINVELVPKSKRTKSSLRVGEEAAALIKKIPGALVAIEQVGILDTGTASSPVSYTVSGPSYESNMAGAKALAGILKSVKGTGDVRVSARDGMPELKIGIDRAKLSSLGLGLDSVGASLRTALAGDDSLLYTKEGSDYAIKAVLDSFDRTSTDQVANISFTNDQGRQIRLGQFATIRNGFGPTELTRLDRENSITVSSQALGRTTGDIDKDVQAALGKAKLPDDVAVKTAGTLSMQGDAFGSLGFALVLSMVLIYAILAILFNSLSYPLSVMFSLPFAMIGGFFALAATRLTLNIFSIMAVILLIGLSAKNAILLLDRALANRNERGMDTVEALREAVATRIRPIFMTTAAMVFGMLPLALGLGSAGEMKQAMGVALIGGLVFGLLVTMILVPVSFLSIESLRERGSERKAGKASKEIANA